MAALETDLMGALNLSSPGTQLEGIGEALGDFEYSIKHGLETVQRFLTEQTPQTIQWLQDYLGIKLEANGEDDDGAEEGKWSMFRDIEIIADMSQQFGEDLFLIDEARILQDQIITDDMPENKCTINISGTYLQSIKIDQVQFTVLDMETHDIILE